MNIGKLYRSYKRWSRVFPCAITAFVVGIFLAILSVSPGASKGRFFVLLVISLGGLLLAFCSLFKVSVGTPLSYQDVALIDRWLELGLGTVDEFPIDETSRKKIAGWVEEKLILLADDAFGAAEERDLVEKGIESMSAKSLGLPKFFPEDRAHRERMEFRLGKWRQATQDRFNDLFGHWDFFEKMCMLPKKQNGKKPKPYKNVDEFIKEIRKGYAERNQWKNHIFPPHAEAS